MKFLSFIIVLMVSLSAFADSLPHLVELERDACVYSVRLTPGRIVDSVFVPNSSNYVRTVELGVIGAGIFNVNADAKNGVRSFCDTNVNLFYRATPNLDTQPETNYKLEIYINNKLAYDYIGNMRNGGAFGWVEHINKL